MNAVHRTILDLLKAHTAADGNPLGHLFTTASDDEAVRELFMSYRGVETARGLRLTATGLQLMKCYFRAYEIKLPEGHRIKPLHLVWLDRAARLPYHYSAEYLVLFELDLGTKLKLADGDIGVLIDIEQNR